MEPDDDGINNNLDVATTRASPSHSTSWLKKTTVVKPDDQVLALHVKLQDQIATKGCFRAPGIRRNAWFLSASDTLTQADMNVF